MCLPTTLMPWPGPPGLLYSLGWVCRDHRAGFKSLTGLRNLQTPHVLAAPTLFPGLPCLLLQMRVIVKPSSGNMGVAVAVLQRILRGIDEIYIRVLGTEQVFEASKTPPCCAPLPCVPSIQVSSAHPSFRSPTLLLRACFLDAPAWPL